MQESQVQTAQPYDSNKDGGPNHLVVDWYLANEGRQKSYNFYYLLHQGSIYSIK